MVGFGSSLRMGRRPGWEGAYLDYETLKLLLSQVEAVYEEQNTNGAAAAAAAAGGANNPYGQYSHSFLSQQQQQQHYHDHDRHTVDQGNGRNGGDGNDNNNNNQRRRRLKTGPPLDYRDQLFLESDSEAAFASDTAYFDNEDTESDEDGDGDEDEDNEDDDYDAYHDANDRSYLDGETTGNYYTDFGSGFGGSVGFGRHNQQQHQPFLSYSAQVGYSSSEDSGSDNVGSDRCGGVPWRKEKKSPSVKTSKKKTVAPSTKKKKRRKHSHGHTRNHTPMMYDEDDYFPTHRPIGPNTFIIAEESGSGYVGFGDSRGSGIGDEADDEGPVPFSFPENERTSLLPPTQGMSTGTGHNSSMEATLSADESTGVGGGQLDPNFVNTGLMGFSSDPSTSIQPSILPPSSSPSSANMLIRKTGSNDLQTPRKANTKVTKRDKKAQAKKRTERARRRKRLAKLRKERDRKVPPTLRLAHTKSRAIAERFLGLLRAEVEKVVLFAQARLGELADTAGGLRFMTSDDLTEMGEKGMTRSAKSAYDYSFSVSDGGIHPSASSSSDEGVGTLGGAFPWSDSDNESDEDESRMSARQRLENSLPSPRAMESPRMETNRKNERVFRKGPITENQEKMEATIRKINHFEAARKKRPIFNRNADILGDELLLMSAVDEADAYSAVGVELLHVLRFICINTIAVRKLIRKHDKLLMNRMLGGYYHKERARRRREEMTLGGLVAHVAGDAYEAHPALVNHGKLMGVFDLKIQQLANSRTVKVVSSCLALALSEYEVSRNRADALARLNPSTKNKRKVGEDDSESKKSKSVYTLGTIALSTATSWVKSTAAREDDTLISSLPDHDIFHGSDDESEGGPPSTTSSLSLSRLQYTVLTIAALREAARNKVNPYSMYLSRGCLTFTGKAEVGAGLDGCSRDVLDAILAFNPDSPLLLDSSAIYEGLKSGQWRQERIESVMVSSLAVALSHPNNIDVMAPIKVSPRTIRQKEDVIFSSLSILPKKSEDIDTRSPFHSSAFSVFLSISRFVTFPSYILRSHRLSSFLYTMNYFVVHPTAVPFVSNTTANSAYSAIIIGAPTLSAILISLIHCHLLSDLTTMGQKPDPQRLVLFRNLFLFSAFAAIFGNIVQARGMAHQSIPHAVLGRFLLGFASSDIVQRQFISSQMPLQLVAAESARLSHVQIVGQLVGFLFGSLVSWSGVLVAGNWCMMIFWIFYSLYVVTGDTSGSMTDDNNDNDHRWEVLENKETDRHIISPSVSSESDEETGGPALLFKQRSSYVDDEDEDITKDDPDEKTGLLVSKVPSERPNNKSDYHKKYSRRPKRRLKRIRTFTKRFRKLLAFNISIPICFAFVLYCKFSLEAFVSSCPLVGYHYFDWTGQLSGCFLAFLSLLLVPADVISEQIARRYEERTILKRGVIIISIGLLFMINWGSVLGLLPKIQNLLEEDQHIRRHEYDWFLGVFQYVGGIMTSIIALRSIDVASCSLLSKVSPPDLRSISINVGTIATFIGLVGQLAADLQIAAVVLSHRLINSDVVNALIFPILLGSLAAFYFVRKHFFFLM